MEEVIAEVREGINDVIQSEHIYLYQESENILYKKLLFLSRGMIKQKITKQVVEVYTTNRCICSMSIMRDTIYQAKNQMSKELFDEEKSKTLDVLLTELYLGKSEKTVKLADLIISKIVDIGMNSFIKDSLEKRQMMIERGTFNSFTERFIQVPDNFALSVISN